jgi:hypothetical protein
VWLVEDALALGRPAGADAPARELAARADRAPEMLLGILDGLAYHGQLALLRDLLRLAWPRLEEEDEEEEFLSEFAGRGVNCELFARLEEVPALDATDPELPGRVAFFDQPYPPEGLAERLDFLTGRRATAWAAEEFALERGNKGKGRAARREREKVLRPRFEQLSQEFLRHLRHREGVPYPRGELARKALVDYLLARLSGDLGHGKRKEGPDPGDALLPDADTLDGFLGRSLGGDEGELYGAAAFFEALPAWLRFLESKGLATAGQHRRALEELRPVRESLLPTFEEDMSDPSPAKALAAWPGPPGPPPG